MYSIRSVLIDRFGVLYIHSFDTNHTPHYTMTFFTYLVYCFTVSVNAHAFSRPFPYLSGNEAPTESAYQAVELNGKIEVSDNDDINFVFCV